MSFSICVHDGCEPPCIIVVVGHDRGRLRSCPIRVGSRNRLNEAASRVSIRGYLSQGVVVEVTCPSELYAVEKTGEVSAPAPSGSGSVVLRLPTDVVVRKGCNIPQSIGNRRRKPHGIVGLRHGLLVRCSNPARDPDESGKIIACSTRVSEIRHVTSTISNTRDLPTVKLALSR